MVGCVTPTGPHRRTATVVGGGPAGLMAAEVLADAGLHVTVHEHMASPGRKLLLAGRSGLNITHGEPLSSMLPRFGAAADRLGPAVESFGPGALRAWCSALGQPTFVGSSGRVFPEAFRATPLLRAWLARLLTKGVDIRVRSTWLGWGAPQPEPTTTTTTTTLRFRHADGTVHEVSSDVAVLALGGASWPRVGSDGGWASTVAATGVRVTPLRPANCAALVRWTDHFAERFAGTALKNVSLATTGPHDQRQVVRGDVTITRTGLESGPVYACIPALRDELDRLGRGELVIDLCPDSSATRLAERLRGRRPKESASTWLRRAAGLSPAAIGVLRESPPGRNLPTEGAAMAALLKAVPVAVHATASLGRAISTAGGVALDEVDDSFMLRRLPGTFVAGEMLDWEAPTGGYLLQGTFSTAVAAARGAIAWSTAGDTTDRRCE